MGLLGIVLILGFAYAFSNNRKAIAWQTIIGGLILQFGLALFILKTPWGQALFAFLADAITQILDYANAGSGFVFGPLVNNDVLAKSFGPQWVFIIAFRLSAMIIFVSSLVSILYYLGAMQRIIQALAWAMERIMKVSGAEALSNVSTAFVGQIEAQLMIKPYVAKMTQSELLASMSGSLACIAGSVMATYISLGVPAQYLLTASVMAAPGALVIAKLLYPETETPQTSGKHSKNIELQHDKAVNIVDAAAQGASEGMKISLQVITMLIGFLSLIALVNGILNYAGNTVADWGWDASRIGIDFTHLTLQSILSIPFALIAFCLGVSWPETHTVGALIGTKLVANEFVAYQNYLSLGNNFLSAKSAAITTVALCGFANFGSVAMMIGGIGEMAPSRKGDLARLGMRALVAGSMASYLSAAIVGLLT